MPAEKKEATRISADDARALAHHHRLYFLDVDHRRVAGRRQRQRAMCRAVHDGGLRTLALHESIRETGRESVAAADAVIDLEVLAHHRLVELAAGVQDRR